MLEALIKEVTQLAALFDSKATEFADVLHLGRTCLQDAQPMRLGQLFGGYASLTKRLAEELVPVRDNFLWVAPQLVPASARPRVTVPLGTHIFAALPVWITRHRPIRSMQCRTWMCSHEFQLNFVLALYRSRKSHLT